MKKNYAIFAAIAVVGVGLYLLVGLITAPSYRNVLADPIDPSADPVQIALADAEPIPISFKKGSAELTLKAAYKVATRVCGKKRYHQRWQAYVVPYDLCLSWGRLATEDLKGRVSFTQDMRWYQFRYHRDSGFDQSYVRDHSANTHVLPANKTIRKAIARLDRDDVVEMTGYLVYLNGKYKGYDIWWKSSLTRTDSGNGSCEVFYVTSLRRGDRLYGQPTDVD